MTPELKAMLIAGFRPPWQDREVLGLCVGIVDNTIDAWVADGTLPPARKRGGKLLWKWSEVDERLTLGKEAGKAPPSKAEEIRNGTRAAAAAAARH
jgi:predicted DNA-binding transcriptional regulator AlpA